MTSVDYPTPTKDFKIESLSLEEDEEEKQIQKKCRTSNRLIALGFFAIGACVEVYTFNKTGSISKSTGLGWGTFMAFCLL